MKYLEQIKIENNRFVDYIKGALIFIFFHILGQALAVIQESGMDPDTVNVNGGAVAMGHPLGCTGAKLTIQLLNEMQRRKQKYGMVTACVGGGQGIAGIFERL